MNIDSMFPSKYLKASDLEEGPLTLNISGVEMEKMGDGEMKPVLYFANETKGLVFNVTNKNVVKELYGSDTDNWGGKPITLIASTTDFAGKVVDCIRLRPPKAALKAAAAAAIIQAQTPVGNDLDDDIPF